MIKYAFAGEGGVDGVIEGQNGPIIAFRDQRKLTIA